MNPTRCAAVVIAFCILWGQTAASAVLCIRKSGIVVVRDACKKRESPLDVAASVQRIDTFTGGWQDYQTVGNPAAFYKDPFGIVHLSGSIFGGVAGSYAFTLPAGFRGGAMFFASSSSDAVVTSSFCTITIYPLGEVFVGADCNSAQVGLDGITFLATG